VHRITNAVFLIFTILIMKNTETSCPFSKAVKAIKDTLNPYDPFVKPKAGSDRAESLNINNKYITEFWRAMLSAKTPTIEWNSEDKDVYGKIFDSFVSFMQQVEPDQSNDVSSLRDRFAQLVSTVRKNNSINNLDDMFQDEVLGAMGVLLSVSELVDHIYMEAHGGEWMPEEIFEKTVLSPKMLSAFTQLACFSQFSAGHLVLQHLPESLHTYRDGRFKRPKFREEDFLLVPSGDNFSFELIEHSRHVDEVRHFVAENIGDSAGARVMCPALFHKTQAGGRSINLVEASVLWFVKEFILPNRKTYLSMSRP
jgi:hypothetical protein